MIHTGRFPPGVLEVPVPVGGGPPPAARMAEPRLAAPEFVAAFPDFFLIFPVFAMIVIVVVSAEDIFLKEFKIKSLSSLKQFKLLW